MDRKKQFVTAGGEVYRIVQECNDTELVVIQLWLLYLDSLSRSTPSVADAYENSARVVAGRLRVDVNKCLSIAKTAQKVR